MKSITLDVCQGVGDIFWVYQKFAPHFDEINFNVCRIHGLESDKLQNRAKPFLELLPKVNKIEWLDINHWAYIKLASKSFKMKDVIESGAEHTYYSCNRDLEKKIRLEDIDPEYSVQETVDIYQEPMELPSVDKFVCIYISGNTFNDRCKHEVWTVDQWLEFIEGFYSKQSLCYPMLLIGASYDEDVIEVVKSRLEEDGHNCHVFIDLPPANVMYILKECECFIGYACGLNILADNMDVKQIMMFPDSIEGLCYSWCKKRNMDNGIYNAALFSEEPQAVLKSLDLIITELL